MNKLLYLTLSGLLLAIAGVSMLFTEQVDLGVIKIIASLAILGAGVLSILFALANKKLRIPANFQLIQGGCLAIYAIAILFLSKDLHQYLMTASYFLMLYGFIEIIFPFSILNSPAKIKIQPFIFRIVGGGITVLGALFLLLITPKDEANGILIAGGLIILIGISNVFFANRVKRINLEDLSSEDKDA